MLRKNYIKSVLLLLAFFVLFSMLYAGSQNNVFAQGSMGQKQFTDFTSYSSGLNLSIYIDYDIPSHIASNVTIVTGIEIYRDMPSNHSLLILNYSTRSDMELVERSVPSDPGNYSIVLSTSVIGNNHSKSEVLMLPPNATSLYVSVNMPRSMIFMYPMIAFGILTAAMIPVTIRFGKSMFGI